jgi:hypothetical protein
MIPTWSALLPRVVSAAALLVFSILAATLRADDPPAAGALDAAVAEAEQALLARQGAAEAARIHRGAAQVRRYWRPEDGDGRDLRSFLVDEFVPSGPALDATFDRLEFVLERVSGYFNSMSRDLKRGADLEVGPLLPLDQRLAGWDPSAHLSEDAFANRIAFVALLNFPLSTLEERDRDGKAWTRRQWAEARLAQAFSVRVPADVNNQIAKAYADAQAYIADYNIRMHHVLAADGGRPFPAGMRLISHWNLRDELKARYGDPAGLSKQRLISTIMERIVRQEIPAAVIDNPLLDWDPVANRVFVSPVKDGDAPAKATPVAKSDREPDTRYATWLAVFRAERLQDAYRPDAPSHIARRFDLDRQIPEEEVSRLLLAVLEAPVGQAIARLIAERLGRPTEPFDIWYSGFRPKGRFTQAELDAMTTRRYPTPEAYAADIPRMLQHLGFSPARARFLAERIIVDPSRGAGHALGATRRDDEAHLRTRVGPKGMDYKGYNIAVHEMGHTVEQVFSTTTIDHTLLHGVPNNAFTEAMAFVFQARDLELLGLPPEGAQVERLRALDAFWQTREIAGVALVDMAAWRWLYAHQDATPAEFRQAVVTIALDVWNRHFAQLLGARDVPLLAIYSHLISEGLYLPDYPLGHLIAFQIERHFERHKGATGLEFERLCQQGSITPEAWMVGGLGEPLSAQPLLDATGEALRAGGLGARDR